MAERKVGPWQRFENWLDAPRFACGLAIFAVVVLAFGFLSQIDLLRWIEPVDQFIGDFYANVTTDLLSIALTVLVIDRLNERRATKDRLIRQMGSPDNGLALLAVQELRARGWLEDGSLRGAILDRAGLQKADLTGADMQKARLVGANLQEVNLFDADLQEAGLNFANLRGAHLDRANLQKARLDHANLQGAYMKKTELQGASLWPANLRGALLAGANLEGVLLIGADLQDASLLEATDLRDEQLVRASRLQGATLPDSSRYDGRFNLRGDIEAARGQGIDTDDPEAMAEFYKASLEEYERGQAWAREHLEELRARSRAWHQEHWSGGEYRP